MNVREREVCESEIVFQRQICKPLEQLVSSFHSDETIPTESYICRLSTHVLSEDVCVSLMANIWCFFLMEAKHQTLSFYVQYMPFAASRSLQCVSEQCGY